jgi:outer membrane protein TolC
MRYGKCIPTLLLFFLLSSGQLLFAVELSVKIENITLRNAVEQALENNLNLKLQKEEMEIRQGELQTATGKFDILFSAEIGAQSKEQTPFIPGTGDREDTAQWNAKAEKLFTTGTAISFSWNNNSYDSNAIGLPFNPSYNSGLLLQLKQPLLKGFGKEIQTSNIRAVRKQLSAVTHQVDSGAANLAASVKRAYWNLVYAWQDIEVRRFSLELARKLLEETEEKINAGKLAPMELYQPQSEVAKREELLISAERAIGVAEDELKLLLNSENWLSSYRPVDKPVTTPVQLNLPEILQNALENRPDIKAADLSVQAVEILKNNSADQLRPDLSLVGALGRTGTEDEYGEAVNSSLDDGNNLWQIGLQFSMPFDNSVAKGNLQKINAQLKIAKTRAKLLRQQVRKSVRTTVRDVELAIKALEATRKTSLATRKRLEAEQVKFKSGRATTLDVLIAQDAYSQALSQENLTDIAYAKTLAELDRIQGLITLTSAP